MAFKSVNERNTSVVHACIVCAMCLRLNRLQRPNGKEGILMDAVPFLSVYLGHAGINETAKYLKFSNELFPESIDSFGRFMSDLLAEADYEE